MKLEINAYTAEACESGIAALTALLSYYKAQPQRAVILGGLGIAQHQAQPAVAENTGNQETVQSHTGPLVGSAPEVEALPASTSEAVTEKPKRAKKVKEEAGNAEAAATAAQALAEPAASTTATPAATSKPLTIDDLRAALQRFTAANGMPAGVELLKGFDCARISELAEKGDDVKTAFVAKCPVLEAA